MDVVSTVQGIGGSVKELNNFFKNISENDTVNVYRKLNYPCVILNDGMIYTIKCSSPDNRVRSEAEFDLIVKQCFRDGYVKLNVFDDSELCRYIPISRVLEFTLGSDDKVNTFSAKLARQMSDKVNAVKNRVSSNSSISSSNRFNP